jgi:hypothetical protein
LADQVKNPVLPYGASSKEKAILAIHPRSSGLGILAFSRNQERNAEDRRRGDRRKAKK